MEQQISFCTTPEGVRIAYATVGQGPALVVPFWWPAHLQLTWQNPLARSFLERLARHHTVVRYDHRGMGLSDPKWEEVTLEAELRDFETVIDHLKLKRLALLGIGFGGPVAIAYAAKHPRRISRLILYGTCARGEAISTEEVKSSLISLLRAHGGLGSKTFADVFVPGIDATTSESFAKAQLESTANPEIGAQLLGFLYKVDVIHLLPGLRVPTLVLHRQRERAIPFRLGRELAALIPNAQFIPLEGNLQPPWYGDSDSVVRVIAEFLGDPVAVDQVVVSKQPAAQDLTVAVDDPVADEARSFIVSLDRVAIGQYRVVRDFTRYDDTVRNMLKDVQHKIVAGIDRSSRKRENHLIWAAPGSGKTYFVQQVAAALTRTICYQECNLANCSREGFLSILRKIDTENKHYLCLIDEIDAKPHEAWPYEVLLPYLDASVDRGAQFVFVLAGSSGSSLIEMKERIALRHKGADLLSRIPADNEYEIPTMNFGDRILVILSQFRQVGRELGWEVQYVEKLGLYYIALNSSLANARQLRELAVRAIERLPAGEDRVKYDHLFGAGDPENKAFWMQSLPAAAALANRYVALGD